MAINAMTIIDAESHVFEPDVIWEKYLAPEYRVPARSAFYHHYDLESGLTTVILNGKPARPMNQSKLIRQAIWRPGMTPEQVGNLDPKKTHPINPGAQDPEARLKDMDTLGIDKALLFPTLFAEYFPVVDNPDVASALARAYNDWIYDFTSGTRDRLIPAMVLPTQDVGFAIQELQRNARRGFKVVSLRPIFYDGKFLNHPMYNPLWEAVEQSGLAVLLYASPGMTNPEWTCEGSFVERVAANLKIGHTVTETCAPLMDNNNAFTCFITNGHYENFPNLKLGYVGSGASWITLSLEKAESFMQLAADLRDVTLEPEEVFLDRAPLVQFDGWETPPARMYDVYGKFAGWGSRYPQHITSTPQEALNTLSKCGVPTDVAAQMMGGNAARFIGL